MRTIRHLPPLVQAVRLLALLAILASLGINTWAFLLGRTSGETSTQLRLVGWATLELGLLYMWMVTAYTVRFAPDHHRTHAAPWLDSVRGQVMSALIGGVIALATVVVSLVSPPAAQPIWVAIPCSVLFLVVWYTVFGWAMV